MFSLNQAVLKRVFHFFCMMFACCLFLASHPLPDVDGMIAPKHLDYYFEESSINNGVDDLSCEASQKIYAITLESNSIVPVNLEQQKMEAEISIEFPAKILAYSHDEAKVFLADFRSGRLVKMNLASKEIEPLHAPEGIPHRLAVRRDGHGGYAIYEGSRDVLSIDFKTGCSTVLASFQGLPDCLVLDPSQNKLFVTVKGLPEIAAIDIATSDISPFITRDQAADALMISNDGKYLFVIEASGQRLLSIDLAKNKSRSVDWEAPIHFSTDEQGATLIAQGQNGSLYLAKERGTEIVEVSLKTQQTKSFIHLSKPISNLLNVIPTDDSALFDESSDRMTANQKRIGNKLTQNANSYAQKTLLASIATTTSLLSSPNPSSSGTLVTLTATINPSAATGTVAFRDGVNTIPGGGSISVSNGQAAFTTNTLSSGTHSLSAVYSGDSAYAGSASNTVTQVVLTPTTTSVTNPPNNSSTIYGQTISFTANVIPAGPPLPTGAVTFSNGIGTATLSNGTASLTKNNLGAGTYAVTANYSGDGTYQPSTSSPAISITVSKATPSVTLSPTIPSTYGNNVTFTATVSNAPNAGTPSGTVSFYDNASNLLQTVTLSNGVATTSAINSLLGGSHSITATYNGDSNFNGITSAAVTQLVNPSATSTSIISLSQSPTAYGQPITLRAIVVGAITPNALLYSPGGTPGTVSFYANTPTPTLLGTSNPITAVLGSNTVTTSITYIPPPFLDVGTYSLYAVYNGDGNYSASPSSPTISQTIIATPTTTTTTSSPNCTSSSSVSLTATVTANAPGSGTPVGSVNFYDGFTLIGSGTLSGGTTTITVNLAPGSHTITSIYVPNTNPQDFTASTAKPITISSSQDSTTTSLTLTGGTNPSPFGNSLTFTATVTPVCSTITPTGTITFYNGATVLGRSTLSGGAASITICNLYPNTYNLTAVYSGDVNFNGSTSTSLGQQVTGTLDTTTTVTASSTNPVAIAPDNTALTATVVANTTCPNLVVNGGTVSFYTGSIAPGNLIGSAGVSNGTATLNSVSFPTQGTYCIVAEYIPMTAPFNTSDTASIYTQCVSPYDTELTLTLAPPFDTSTSSETLTATVKALGDGPFPPTALDGTVNFYDGTSLIDSVAVPKDTSLPFTVTITTSCLSCSTVTADYSGDPCNVCSSPCTDCPSPDSYIGNFDSSSDTIPNQIGAKPTVVTVGTAGTYYICQPVPLTATVSSACDVGACIPTGTVTFFDGTIAIGTALLNSEGIAALDVSTLSLGTHSITAAYNSDGSFAFSESDPIQITIQNAPTTTTLTILPSAGSVYGQVVIFGATVTSPAGIPKGSVKFSDQNGILATVELDVNGKATYQTDLINAGTYTFTATFDGSCCAMTNICFESSSAQISNYVITPVLPKIVFSGTPNPVKYGDTIILNATVTSYSVGTPTGTVVFKLGSTALGTAPIMANNMATLTVSNYLSHVNIPTGSNVIFNATYSGDANFLMANTPQWLETINQAPVTVSLVSDTPNPSFFGKQVTFTATVESVLDIPTHSGNSPVGIPPTGTVKFVIDGNVAGTVTLANGIAAFSTSALSVGSAHTIVAQYSGDANFIANSSATYTQQVEKIGTQTIVTSNANPSTYNTSPTFTVTVSSLIPNQGTPSGTITATYGSYSTSATLNGSGIATFTIPDLQAGIDTILVSYPGNNNFNPSSRAITQAVNPATTVTTAFSNGSNPSSSVFGQPVTLSASVTSGAGTPAGTVSFLKGTTELGVATLTNGNASLVLNSLPVGTSYPITVVYSGASNFATSTTTITQTVNNTNTTTTLASSLTTPYSYGQTVTFTANVIPVSPGAGIPTGSVNFYDGSTLLGNVPLGIGGIATFTPIPTALIVGSHSIKATYVPDNAFNFNTSTSTIVSQSVQPAVTITTVYTPSVKNPSPLSGPGSIDVTVNAVDTGLVVPDGTVQAFYAGTAISLPVNVSTAVNGVISVPVTLPAGTGPFPIVVVYTPGTSPNNFATSSGALDQIIERASTSMVLTSSLNPSIFGQSVTFTATVASSTAVTGAVSFYEGTSLIAVQSVGSGGQATFTTSSLSVGNHTITAAYSGDVNNLPATASLSSNPQVVNPGTTKTSLTSSATSPNIGEMTLLTAKVTVQPPASGTLTGTVTFTSADIGSVVVQIANGVATLPFTFTTAGLKTVTATYGNDPNFSGSFDTIQLTIAMSDTRTGLTSSLNPSMIGQPTVFTATVSALDGSGLPTGTVTFMGNGMTSVTVALVNGVATTAPIPFTAAGSRTITAVYNGDSNYNTSSDALSQQIITDQTTTTLTSTINPTVYGESTTLQATIAASFGSAPLTGTITFYEGSIVIGGPVTVVSNSASLPISMLGVGAHYLTAVYSGDGNYSGSNSNIYTQVVHRGLTSTTLQSSPNPSTYGQGVTFTATVTDTPPAAGTPTGTVNFIENGQVIGKGILSTSAPFTAAITLSNLEVGMHSITAQYIGDGNFDTSTSDSLNQLVTPAPTTTTISLQVPNPSAFGEFVTFIATTIPNPSIAAVVKEITGTVTFYDGPTPLGTVVTNAGYAAFSIQTLNVGNHTISAVYSGDTNYLMSTSPSVSQAVNQTSQTNTSKVTLKSNPNPSDYGCPVTFDITVAPLATPPPFPPLTGTVTLYYGTQPLTPTALVLDANGMASVTIPFGSVPPLPAGDLTIVAIYSGDSNYSASTTTLIQTVNPISTTLQLTTSGSPSLYSEPVTFNASLTASVDCPPTMNFTPTGTVSFYDGIFPVGVLLGTTPLDSNGIATLEDSGLTVGTHAVTAVYNPDPNFYPAIGTVTQVVQCIGTVTEILTAAPTPSVQGEKVTFIASVAIDPLVESIVNVNLPVGVVTFYDTINGSGPTPIGTAPLSNGLAVLSYSNLTVGQHQITLSYQGSAIFCPSALATPGYQQTVNVAALSTNTSLTSSLNPSEYGNSVVFTATVTDPTQTGVPTGTVTFFDQGMAIGTASLVDGNAALATSLLAVGNHSITAYYNGDRNYYPSTSPIYVQNVICLNTITTLLTASPNPSVQGKVVTFIVGVTVNPDKGSNSETAAPNGQVTFYDTVNGVGPNVIGMVTLANGLAVLDYANLSVGTHSITAAYSGSTNFCPSALAAPGYQQVVIAALLPTDTIVVSSLNPAEVGNQVTFTANVTDPSRQGVPTGIVTFFDGEIVVGISALVNGVAELSTSTLTIGSHPISAQYSGDSHYLPSESSIDTQVIIASSYPLPPHDFFGCQRTNRFADFKEFVNVLTWTPPQNDTTIVRYEIYRNAALTNLAGIVKAKQCDYRFEDRQRKPKRTYTYYIVSVNAHGKKSPPVVTKVIPIQKKKG